VSQNRAADGRPDVRLAALAIPTGERLSVCGQLYLLLRLGLEPALFHEHQPPANVLPILNGSQ
jgi:hypothetical protein